MNVISTPPASPVDLRGEFERFAEICAGQSPLYALLAQHIAREPKLLALASASQPGQPPANMLLGAVHFLLLEGARHHLAEFYPSAGGTRPASGEAYPLLDDFCRQFEGPIVELVSTRRVQTNEIGRCGVLLPALGLAWRDFGGRPLYLVEIGASAGLNLLLHRYRYEYTDRRTCGPDSPVRLVTEIRGGEQCPVPRAMPTVAGAVGIDLAPADVRKSDVARWLEALIWPDQLRRLELLRAAIALARREPPRLITGDGIDALPEAAKQAPADSLLCLFHSHSIYQMDRAWRDQFTSLIAELGRRRDLVHISLEWLDDDPGPRLLMTQCRDGDRRTVHLADSHHHGAWIRWVAT